MSVKSVVILGSTGSIGRSSLDVISRHLDKFRVRALAAHSNIDLLLEQYERFLPEYLGVVDPERGEELRQKLAGKTVKVVVGPDEMVGLATIDDVDIVLNAVVGAAGLRASLETVKFGRNLALANKESLVTGGPLFKPLCERTGSRLLPIDSEHSAVWQALAAGREEEIRSIILTASGGPFRRLPSDQFDKITREQALQHPTWEMGNKITIDSATLANKGLEVIEAVTLFSVPVERIRVVIHPQSIVHSMVEFRDSSIIAQLSQPDMRLPIQYALFWPERVESDFGKMNWSELADLTFEEPDFERFPALSLAIEAARTGGTAPAVFNAANEIAVGGFLAGATRFTDIASIIERCLDEVETTAEPDLEQILWADQRARELAQASVEKLTC